MPRPAPWWRSSRTRFAALVTLLAVLIHLSISLLSDPLSALFGVDSIPDTIDSNLGGTAGALMAHLLRTGLGIMHPVVPGVLGYVAIRLIWIRPVRQVLMDVTWVLAMAVLCATALSAGSSSIATGDPGLGGVLGAHMAAYLVGPIGVAGAIILPLAAVAALVSMRLSRERVENLLENTGTWLTQTQSRLRETVPSLLHPFRFIGTLLKGRRNEESARNLEEGVKPPVPHRMIPRGALRGKLEEEAKQEDPVELPSYLRAVLDELPIDTHQTETQPIADLEDSPLPDARPQPAAEAHPPMALFATQREPQNEAAEEAELDAMGERMMEALATYRIRGELVGRTRGARVVSYHIRPDAGIKVSQIEALEREISLALKQSNVRVALAAEHGAIAVEVPHPSPRTVSFRDLYDHPVFRESKHLLPVAIGLDLEGKPVIADLAKMPHLLVGGTTGSGKSVALNVLLTSLCAWHNPDSLRLILVDPKKVEFSIYNCIDPQEAEYEAGNRLPHLRHPVIIDAEDVPSALRWAKGEMERREDILRRARVKNLEQYRAWRLEQVADAEDEAPENLPYLVIVIDELADLMMGEHRVEIENGLVILAQKARAVGIHLVLATQRPDANVVTGLLKANIPVRMAFKVSQAINSRVILDTNGAERLLGYGDMLYLAPGTSEPQRLQGAFISTAETEEFIRWCADTWPVEDANEPEYDILKAVAAPEKQSVDAFGNPVPDLDDLFGQALRVCLANGGASTSLLQRRLQIGYGRAARIIDQMWEANMIGDAQGSKPRELLYDEDMLETLGY